MSKYSGFMMLSFAKRQYVFSYSVYQYGQVAWQYARLCDRCEQGGPIYCLNCDRYFEKICDEPRTTPYHFHTRMLHEEQGPRAAFMKPVRQQGRPVSQTAILGSCTI
jgi:hypothetical protein